VEHFCLKLRRDDEDSFSHFDSSTLLARELMRSDSLEFKNCRGLLSFNAQWHQTNRNRHDGLLASLRTCSVRDFTIEATIGQGSAGQLFRARPPTRVEVPPRRSLSHHLSPETSSSQVVGEAAALSEGAATTTTTATGAAATTPAAPAPAPATTVTTMTTTVAATGGSSSAAACVALKKIWDLNGGAGPSETEFVTAQRKDYTVPLRYPHPCVVLWRSWRAWRCAYSARAMVLLVAVGTTGAGSKSC
jgi:hypothetical protein